MQVCSMFSGQFNRASQRIVITPAIAVPDTIVTKGKTNHATTQVSGWFKLVAAMAYSQFPKRFEWVDIVRVLISLFFVTIPAP